MEKIVNPRSISTSIGLYRALLNIYPSTFKEEYGWQMVQVFGDCCRRVVRAQGVFGLIPLWMRTMLDTLATAIEEHLLRGTDMSKEKLTRLSGWAFILGGITFVTAWLASTRPDFDPSNYYSLGIDRIANAITAPLIVSTLLLISFGMLGLAMRFGQSRSKYGYLSLLIGVASGLVSVGSFIVDLVGLQFISENISWFLFFYGMGLMFAGLAVWGIECLRLKHFHRGNVLALFSGLWFPLFIMISGLYEFLTGNWIDNMFFVDWILFVFTAVGLILLGFQLQSDWRQETFPATT